MFSLLQVHHLEVRSARSAAQVGVSTENLCISTRKFLCCAGEASLKSAQLELQLQTRKQEADMDMLQSKLQQEAAALVRRELSSPCSH